MSNFSLMMVPGQTKKHYGYAVQRKNALVENGAEIGNVEYEIVTKDTKGEDDSISKWKLDNLAVFEMNAVKEVDNKKNIQWEEYVVFEFVASRNNDTNEGLKVVMVTDVDGDGDKYGKVYVKDVAGDGFKNFELKDLFGAEIGDASSIESSAKYSDSVIDTTLNQPPTSESEKKKTELAPELEPEEIVLRASKVQDKEKGYNLFFLLPMGTILQNFSFKINNKITDVKQNTLIQNQNNYGSFAQKKVFRVGKTINEKMFEVFSFTTEGDIKNLFSDVKITIVDEKRSNSPIEKNVDYIYTG